MIVKLYTKVPLSVVEIHLRIEYHSGFVVATFNAIVKLANP